MNARSLLPTFLRLAALLALLFGAIGAPAPAPAQAQSRTFPETGKTVGGIFLRYWEAHGGLMQQGFPISAEMVETSETDGKTYTVQYFERAVFERHPENAGKESEVLLSLLGVWQYRALYGPAGAPGQAPNTTPGSALFPETGKRVGGRFLDYWMRNGGLAQQGYPISDEIREVSAIDGQAYTVQYFERAVFEHHPENEGKPSEVLLSLLGAYRYNVRYAAPAMPAPEAGRAQIDLAASDLFLAWREVELGETNPEPGYRPSYVYRALDLRTGRVVRVVETRNEFSRPAISGSIMAWAGENLSCGECDLDVFALDLATGEVTVVATGPQIQVAPSVYGRAVAWVEQDAGAHLVIVKDLAAGTTTRLTDPRDTPPALITEVALGGSRVLVTRVDDARNPTTYSLELVPLGDGPTKVLASGALIGPMSIALSGRYAVAGTGSAVSVYDLDSGEQRSYKTAGPVIRVGAGGGLAFWTEQPEEGSALWVVRLEGAAAQPTAAEAGGVRNPAAASDRLFYFKDARLISRPLTELFGGETP